MMTVGMNMTIMSRLRFHFRPGVGTQASNSHSSCCHASTACGWRSAGGAQRIENQPDEEVDLPAGTLAWSITEYPFSIKCYCRTSFVELCCWTCGANLSVTMKTETSTRTHHLQSAWYPFLLQHPATTTTGTHLPCFRIGPMAATLTALLSSATMNVWIAASMTYGSDMFDSNNGLLVGCSYRLFGQLMDCFYSLL